MFCKDLLQPLAADEGEAAPNETGRWALVVVLVGGIYILASVPVAMGVLTRQKIVQDPTGPGAEAFSDGQALFWVGWAVASALTTPLTDRYGRRRPMYLLVAVGLVATLAETLVTTAWLYKAAWFTAGFTLPPAAQIAYVLMQESLPERLHASAIVTLNVFFGGVGVATAVVGGTLARGLGWRAETLLWHVPHAVMLLVGCFVVQESPKFLAVQEAREAADSADGHADFLGPCRLLLSPPLLGRLIAIVMCWTACSLGYYGLSYAAGNLSPSLYTNFALLSAVDVVGNVLAEPMVEPLGARRTQLLVFPVAGCCLAACALLPPNTWQLWPALLGRLFVDIAFVTVYILLFDCFPTQCRGTASGIANGCCRLLTLVTPLFGLLPLLQVCAFMAALCLLACLATWTLPEERCADVSAGGKASCFDDGGLGAHLRYGDDSPLGA